MALFLDDLKKNIFFNKLLILNLNCDHIIPFLFNMEEKEKTKKEIFNRK